MTPEKKEICQRCLKWAIAFVVLLIIGLLGHQLLAEEAKPPTPQPTTSSWVEWLLASAVMLASLLFAVGIVGAIRNWRHRQVRYRGDTATPSSTQQSAAATPKPKSLTDKVKEWWQKNKAAAIPGIALLTCLLLGGATYFRFKEEIGWGWWNNWWWAPVVTCFLAVWKPKIITPLIIVVWLGLMFGSSQPAREMWSEIGKSAAAAGTEKRDVATRAATPKRCEWKVIVFYPQRKGESSHPAVLVDGTADTKVFLYYGLRTGKDDYGTVRLTKSNGDGRWKGEWRQPGGWGVLILTSDTQEVHFTGRWSAPDSPDPEWKKGGAFQIIKQ